MFKRAKYAIPTSEEMNKVIGLLKADFDKGLLTGITESKLLYVLPEGRFLVELVSQNGDKTAYRIIKIKESWPQFFGKKISRVIVDEIN